MRCGRTSTSNGLHQNWMECRSNFGTRVCAKQGVFGFVNSMDDLDPSRMMVTGARELDYCSTTVQKIDNYKFFAGACAGAGADIFCATGAVI